MAYPFHGFGSLTLDINVMRCSRFKYINMNLLLLTKKAISFCSYGEFFEMVQLFVKIAYRTSWCNCHLGSILQKQQHMVMTMRAMRATIIGPKQTLASEKFGFFGTFFVLFGSMYRDSRYSLKKRFSIFSHNVLKLKCENTKQK